MRPTERRSRLSPRRGPTAFWLSKLRRPPLYAFAEARCKPVLCFAYVTNQMGQSGDFEKGEANGAIASLALVRAVAEAYLQTCPSPIQLAPVGSAIEPGMTR
jgi:hypothetical protein